MKERYQSAWFTGVLALLTFVVYVFDHNGYVLFTALLGIVVAAAILVQERTQKR